MPAALVYAYHNVVVTPLQLSGDWTKRLEVGVTGTAGTKCLFTRGEALARGQCDESGELMDCGTDTALNQLADPWLLLFPPLLDVT